MKPVLRLFTIINQAVAELWRHKLRTVLTMFGIGWGICALALISASGDGFKQGQRENWKQLGDRIVMVFGGRTELQAGGRRAGKDIRLYASDVKAIREQCNLVETVAGEIKRWGVPVESEINAGTFLVVGVDPDYLSLRNMPAGAGRDVNWTDVKEKSRVCVLGDSVRKQLFREERDLVGRQVRINGYRYEIVGLMDEKNQNSSYDGWDNDKVLIPTSAFRSDCPPFRGVAVEGRVQTIIYRPKSVSEWEPAQLQVRRTLARIHEFDPRDEAALPMWDTMKTASMFDEIFKSLGYFLGSVALVTLILGAMGVMNTMMTSVTERTPEIGLKKALGATRRRILVEFFAEGLFLAGISGTIGIILVWGLASLINALPMPAFFSGLPVNPDLVLRLVVLLGGVGILAALPPAWRAAGMTPVEALRFEK